ncbi:MAG TPA: type IV secretion system DNA-binding domain-containing protein [Candidatus Saccharimonadales bacterium]|nr:type IV secretion system DNA-binding domain-containing protein [Candidatus Saccharimonadales bacterium]
MGPFLLEILSKWYIWLPIAAVFAYLAFRNNLRAKTVADTEHTLLILEIPRTNDKKELAAEQMFASLHGILRDKKELLSQGGLQEHISFEIASIDKQIRFYVWVPTHLQNFLEGQIYAQYPTVQIHKADSDYTEREILQPVIYSAELALTDNEALPIKTFQSFEVDPLAAVTATLAKLEEQNEEIWIQVLARPVSDGWHFKSTRFANKLKGKANSGVGHLLLGLLQAFFKPPEAKDSSAPEISERDKSRISEIEKKSVKLGYQVKMRILYLGNTEKTAKLRMQAIVGTFKQFNSTNLNGFQIKGAAYGQEGIDKFRARFFIDKGYILNIEELASVYHLPHTTVETPNIVWASSKTAEPPAKLPIILGTDRDNEISAFGLTNFRGINQQFGLFRGDRGRHAYIIGQTGTGKSGMLELLALSDIFHNQGYAIIDPHGDFAMANLKFIPPSRIKDVVYFNPADMQFPIGFNPMEVSDPNMKSHISSEVIGVLKRMFGDSWGPRLEYILRYTILALLDYPNTTLLDITRMLTDKKFRKAVVENCQDTVVRQFWNVEFASWNDKFLAEAISPVLNKVGAFTANPIIRNIIGQPKSTFNIRKIMDEGKILVVNLSKGLIGEDNAGILGSFLVTKIQLAAMSRSDIPLIEDRRPFYLYVDEFQNFATDSFATILSEARKYGLNLTVANQYISQMGETVRDAVFGNVGTTISFRVSPDDSQILGKQFAPQFLPEDIMQMANRHFVITMVINGEKTPSFSARTLTLPPAQTNFTEQIVQNTRQNYARPVNDVVAEIQQNVNPTHNQQAVTASNKPKEPKPDEVKPLPIVNETKIEQAKPAEQPAPQSEPALTAAASEPESASKKRRRRRKRSKSKQGSEVTTGPEPHNDSSSLSLR